MEMIWRDLIHGLQTLRRNPGFTAIVVLILALGLGANTAIFSVLNAVILQPLPYRSPDRLVMLPASHQPEDKGTELSVPNFLDWRQESRSFKQLGAFAPASFNLSGGSSPERIEAAQVTPDVLAALGTKPLMGRLFLPGEEKTDARLVILSYSLWRSHFAGDPNVVGKVIQLGGVAYPIIGVMPPRFDFPSHDVQLWVPLGITEWLKARRSRWVYIMGRLKDGVSLQSAQQDMDGVTKALAERYPRSNTGWGTRLVPLQEHFVGKVRPALLILAMSVALVLLLACANIANLELARAAERRREMAIRSAIGARASAVFRQLLIEGLILALLGGLLGLVLAHWSLRLLITWGPKYIPRLDEVGINGSVLLVTLGLSLMTGVIFSLAPALSALKPDLVGDLREGEHFASSGVGRIRFRRILTIAEVAIALVLLVSAGLLLSSLLHLQRVDPGFNPKDVLAMQVVLSSDQYPKEIQRTTFFRELAVRAARVPGVEAAAGVSDLPLGGTSSSESFVIEGQPVDPTAYPEAGIRGVTPGYFKVVQIPLLQGRDFSPQDTKEAPKAVIVNKAFADRYWPRENPVGKRIGFTGADKSFWEVIGVIGNIHHARLDVPTIPEIYISYEQINDWDTMVLVVRSKTGIRQLTSQLRAQVASLDPQQPVFNVRTLGKVLAQSTSEPKLYTTLLSAFAGLALVLSALGIYSIISYSVTQRRHEFGIRVAMGAVRRDVLKLVVGEGVFLAAVGILAGLIGAWIATRGLASLLFGVQAYDPLIVAGTAALLGLVALAASLIPAVRASQVSPMTAFRTQ
jgi:putative ABC transport system permease protein